MKKTNVRKRKTTPLKKNSSKKSLKVIWAVDAFSEKGAIAEGAAAKLAAQLAARGAVVQPVFTLSEAEINMWSVSSAPDMDSYVRVARDNIIKALAKMGKVKFAPAQVLDLDLSSKRSGAEALAQFAARQDADLILVQTHGRKGIFRALLGSFTETLVLTAKTPVLAVNPSVSSPKLPGRIAFLTDFSAGSKRALVKVARLARLFDASMTVIHAVPIPSQPVIQSGVALLGAGWVPVGAYMRTETSAQKKKIEKIVATLKRTGVRSVEGIVLASVPSVTSAALAYARKKKPEFMACAVLSSKLRAVLLGAVSRNLLREIKAPLLVVREN